MSRTRRNARSKKQRGGGCGCSTLGGPVGILSGGGDPPGAMGPQRGTPFAPAGGYRATAKNRNALRRFRQGKSIGFTMRASLKAKGLLPRTSRKNRGKLLVSPKYR